MVEIMAEAVRVQKRQWLKTAWSITLSMDDRKDYRIVRFKCDAPVGPSVMPGGVSPALPVAPGGVAPAVSSLCRRGILAVLRNGGRKTVTLEQLDDDKSRDMALSVVGAIESFCTDAGVLDEALQRHILQSVRTFTADGSKVAQKAARILRDEHCRNMVLILRDPAHAVRIACRDPLHAEARFKEQLDRLFGKHGLVPDVQYSDVWRLKLQTCQRRVLETEGGQGGGLAHVMRHFSYAKQRFDSFAAPLRKYCCMVNAIALLLATVASDKRQQAATRARAATSLEAMTFEKLLAAGVSADYAEECADFIRQFDVDDHDPALTGAQARRFEERMRQLFQQAHILRKPPTGQTLTNIVIEQCSEARAIPYGDRIKVLWTRGSRDKVQGVMKSIQVVVDTMLERARASFCGWSAGQVQRIPEVPSTRGRGSPRRAAQLSRARCARSSTRGTWLHRSSAST